MKSIKDLREQYDLITEKEEAETKKLTALVRAGLFDAKKLTSLKRALDKPVDKMTAQEKRMLLNLLDALMSEVLSNQPVYQKVKQNVMMKEEVKDYLSKLDPRYGRGWPTSKEAPGTLLLKRKAIRVFPDGQKVALYYAQSIDKYVSIPYGEIGINENWLTAIVRGAARVLSGGNSSDDTAKKDEDEVAKELKPLEREKAKLNLSTDEKKPYMTGTEARQRKAERDANIAMAKGSVSENFRNKLQALNEAGAPQPPKGYVAPKIRPKAGIGPGGKVAPEKTPWEKLTDIKDDGSLTGMAKDLMPVVGTVRQAKRTGTAYTQTVSDLEKGKYWDATKGAADTALQGFLTGVSGVGDVLTATGVAAPAVTAVRGAISAVKAARTAGKVNKFIATSKTIPVRQTLPAPEKTTAKTTEVPKPKQTATERKTKYSMDLEVQRETNRRAAEAMRKAAEFRTKYPKTKDTTATSSDASGISKSTAADRSAGARTTTAQKFEPPKVAVNKGDVVPKATAADRSAGATKVKTKEPIEFKIAEPATSKGQLVPISAREPAAAPKSGTAPAPAASPKSGTAAAPKSGTVPAPAASPKSGTAPAPKPSPAPGRNAPKPKPDEEGKPKPPPPPKKPFKLPIVDVGATALTSLTPGLKLNLSGPKREGDADAIRSRMAGIERKAWQAQAAAMKESVEINLNGNQFVLNNKEADKVLSLYESLNAKNKQKMIKMMNESEEQLNKIISFAVRQ